ncbi:MAG: hypothetical protein ACTSRC_17130 [Candidatus Helarchaeota archaeon]
MEQTSKDLKIESYKPYIPYKLTPDERELIAPLMELFIPEGFKVCRLPQIDWSYEPPPLFIANPEIDPEINEYRDMDDIDPLVHPNRDRRRPDFITIEDVLGCYYPLTQRIILYDKRISWSARNFKLDPKILRDIVILHEIGHWITYLLPKPHILKKFQKF